MTTKNENPKNLEAPIKGQFPDPDNMMCKTCKFRDKTKVVIGKREIPVGVTKSFCKKYPAPPESNGKPSGILFNGDLCDLYESE